MYKNKHMNIKVTRLTRKIPVMLAFQYFLIVLFPIIATFPFNVKQTHEVNRRSISKWCTLSSDKSHLDCAKVNFIGKTAGIRVKVNKCDDPVTINVNIIIKALGIDWSHDLASDQEFPIPGFEYSIGGIAKVGVYIKTNIYKDDDDKNLKLKLLLRAQLTFGNVPIKLPQLTVFDDVIPIKTKCGKDLLGFSWDNMITGERVGIIAGGCISFILLAVIIITLYVRCRTKRTRFKEKSPPQRKWTVSRTSNKLSNLQNNNKSQNEVVKNEKQNGVLNNIQSYENKQYVSDQTNIKVAGKAGPQKFRMKKI